MAITAIAVTDEAIIHAPRDVVWDKLMSEFNGAAEWWVPDNTFEPHATPPNLLGGSTDVTVHTRGVENKGLRIRFRQTTLSLDAPRRMAVGYSGEFEGEAVFRLVPLADGAHTKLSMTFNADPKGKVGFLNKLADIGGEHSAAALAAFRRLDAIVWREPEPPAPPKRARSNAKKAAAKNGAKST